MIEVIINEIRRKLSEATPDWITNQIKGRHNDGESVCVQVIINTGRANMSLTAGVCGSTGGGGTWTPNPIEEKIYSLWKKLNVSQAPINSGRLIAFLEQVQRV